MVFLKNFLAATSQFQKYKTSAINEFFKIKVPLNGKLIKANCQQK
jgi:hypothetical protein